MAATIPHKIRINDIVMTKGRLRALQQSTIDAIAESIGEIGLQIPITVRIVKGTPHLITGEHRVRAMLQRNETHIDAMVFDNEHDARVWEIDENLARADLTVRERQEHMAARAVLIDRRVQAARKAPPMADRRFTAREAARAAGETFYYPIDQCSNGHNGKRYVSNNTCYECHKEKVARWQENKGYKPVQNAPVYTGGRGNTGGNRAAARELGVDKTTVARAKMFTNLTERAKAEAIKLGLANNHHALKYAAAHHGAELQVRALQTEARKLVEKAERKKFQEMTVQEQAAAAPPSRMVPLIDKRREATENYWLWLVEEFGQNAYAIVNRLREIDYGLLLQIADKAKADGTIKVDAPPKPSVH